jgi:Raf kinase inhibitor-like YbhB/YbcL family protein
MNKFIYFNMFLFFIIMFFLKTSSLPEDKPEEWEVVGNETQSIIELEKLAPHVTLKKAEMLKKFSKRDFGIRETGMNKKFLFSGSFKGGESIPKKYTGEGEDISPQLSWESWEVPENAKSFVLIVHDPDAPDPKAPKIDWIHWVIYNIPVNVKKLSEGISSEEIKSFGASEGPNDFGRKTYGGPNPPIGTHRYFFDLYALDATLKSLDLENSKKFEKLENGKIEKIEFKDFILKKNNILEKLSLMGMYKKK